MPEAAAAEREKRVWIFKCMTAVEQTLWDIVRRLATMGFKYDFDRSLRQEGAVGFFESCFSLPTDSL